MKLIDSSFTMKNKDRIKLKIRALLAKTTENGASEAEAVASLSKAQELMKEYFVSSYELEDPFLGEECVFRSCEMYKGGYDMGFFYNELATLFDCEFYYLPKEKEIFFFGFEQDAELCLYFYNLITKACLKEIQEYKISQDYKLYKPHVHGRTLVASFIKGFLLRIAEKMEEMYRNRKSSIPPGEGLIILEKEDRVRREFDNLGLKIKINNPKQLRCVASAFNLGTHKGNNYEITQGINSYKEEKSPKLT